MRSIGPWSNRAFWDGLYRGRGLASDPQIERVPRQKRTKPPFAFGVSRKRRRQRERRMPGTRRHEIRESAALAALLLAALLQARRQPGRGQGQLARLRSIRLHRVVVRRDADEDGGNG